MIEYDEAARIEHDKIIGPYIQIFERIGSKKAAFDVRVAWKRDTDGERVVMSLGVRDTVGDAITLLRQFQGVAIDHTVKFAVAPFTVNVAALAQVHAEAAAVMKEIGFYPLTPASCALPDPLPTDCAVCGRNRKTCGGVPVV